MHPTVNIYLANSIERERRRTGTHGRPLIRRRPRQRRDESNSESEG